MGKELVSQKNILPRVPGASPFPKYLLAIFTSIFLLLATACAGYWYGYQTALKRKSALTKEKPIPQPLTISPTPSPINPTAGWRNFISASYQFQVKLPEEMKIRCEKDPQNADISLCSISLNDTMGTPGVEQIFLTFTPAEVFEQSDFNHLLELKVGETKQICTLPTPESCFYKRVADFKGKENFRVFENYNAWDLGKDNTQVELITKKDHDSYLRVSFYFDKISLKNGRLTKNLAFQILSTFRFLDEELLSFRCKSEAKEVLALVKKFEEHQKNKEAERALALFTPPIKQEEKEAYAFLSGEDGGVSPRLYSTGSTNFNLLAYEVVHGPQVENKYWCSVVVEESRQFYRQGIGGYSQPEKVTVRLLLVPAGEKEWKIDQYFEASEEISSKYGAWI